jgi:hypothetical protein
MSCNPITHFVIQRLSCGHNGHIMASQGVGALERET